MSTLPIGAGLLNGNGHAWQCACTNCKAGGKPIAERNHSAASRAENRGVIFMGENHVEVQGIPFPKLELDSTSSPVVSERQQRKCEQPWVAANLPTLFSGARL